MGIAVREATTADAPAMAQVFVDTFRTAHRGQMPDWLLETRTYEESERGWLRTLTRLAAETDPQERVVVAVDESGQMVGVAMGGPPGPWDQDRPARDERPTGEVYLLYVDSDHQHRGAGRQLVGEVARFLRERGRSRLLIGVLAAIESARRFYEALGGRLLGHWVFEDEGVGLDEVVYAWSDSSQLLPKQQTASQAPPLNE
ncbi:MAG: GNAT family N-acetyltransferase [Chloroflexota bacterium]|nr:GNAT family N-acetyltransferase [Chloroflexota bacterium]